MKRKKVNKLKKRRKKEDRISNLPDAIIQHILSFLPSTKEAIQTSVLSKRWKKQWTQVPLLILDLPCRRFSNKYSDEDMSRICRSIDSTLIFHDCAKLKKFHIESDWYNFALDPNYFEKLHFPIRKEVEDLRLVFDWAEDNKLPDFFFENPSLIKLQLQSCTLNPNGMVNWQRLKDLYLNTCCCLNQAIEGILSGCLLLESLEIHCCTGFDQRLAIASKSLKKLVLVDPDDEFDLEVLCPNLVEFSALIQDSCEFV